MELFPPAKLQPEMITTEQYVRVYVWLFVLLLIEQTLVRVAHLGGQEYWATHLHIRLHSFYTMRISKRRCRRFTLFFTNSTIMDKMAWHGKLV